MCAPHHPQLSILRSTACRDVSTYNIIRVLQLEKVKQNLQNIILEGITERTSIIFSLHIIEILAAGKCMPFLKKGQRDSVILLAHFKKTEQNKPSLMTDHGEK